MSWSRFLTTVLGSLAALLAFTFAFIVILNPYGNLPLRAFSAHAIMDINQRFQYPAIVRSRVYDSIVIGTSSSRLLDPDRLDAALGGHFANLAMNSARAWEQYQLALLFLRHAPRPKTLLIALDWVWCDARADVERMTERGFPDWMYDENAWNDWLYLLNPRTLEFAGRMLAHRLGLKPVRISANGFEIFVPPESTYDAAKAAKYIWGDRPRQINAVTPAYLPGTGEVESWKFPALVWLRELLSMAPAGTRMVLVYMPAHVANQPAPGSRDAAREAVCKARIGEIGSHRGVATIDFRIHSPMTAADENFWDSLHYRLPIANRIIDGIGKALATRRDDPNGDWVFVNVPRLR